MSILCACLTLSLCLCLNSIKFVADFIRYFLSPELGWNLLPQLEDRDRKVIEIVCDCLKKQFRIITIDNVKFPVLLRACEHLGRFLLLR